MRAFQAKNAQLDPSRVAQFTEPSHGLFNIRGLQQGESDSGLDCMELPATRAAYPALANVQTRRMHLQTLHH